MILLAYNEKINLKIISDVMPEPYARIITMEDRFSTRQEKQDFPFKLKEQVVMDIFYKDKHYILDFEKGFIWNGANIPTSLWGIVGSNANPAFLLPSMAHDKLCNEPNLIERNRLLSSLVFKELLLACGVSKFKANMMFFFVDNYQKLFCKW